MTFSRSFKILKRADSLELVRKVVREVCESVDSPRSLAVWLTFQDGFRQGGNHTELIGLSIDPLNYSDPHSFADDYLVTEFLSKADFLNLPVDRKFQAMEAFDLFEGRCANTNREIRSSINSSERALWINHAVVTKLLKIFQPVDTNLLGEVFDGSKWGPGVTSSSKGNHLSRYNKLSSSLEATTDFISAGARFFVNHTRSWANMHSGGTSDFPACVTDNAFTRLPGNRITTVPKNAKTDRTIAVEPHVNAAFQRGIGIAIRKRLLKAGCDLRDQTRNQKLACLGSTDGSLATIDLRGASDCISENLVRELLPPDWYSLLSTARSHYYEKEGKWFRYNKHSSMGNGYTFELESAIFLSLALACCDYHKVSTEDVSVYGDDIVIPSCVAETFIFMSNLYGFETNKKKTFTSGPFRESCGADFFNGVNVRPFYIRKLPDSLLGIFELANSIRDYSALRCNFLSCDSRFLRAWNIIVEFVPQSLQYFVPKGVDGGFFTEFDEAAPKVRRKRDRYLQASFFEFRRLVFVSDSRKKQCPIVSVGSALWDMSSSGNTDVDIWVDGQWQKPRLPDYVNSPPPLSLDRTSYDLRDSGSLRSVRHEISTSCWSGPGAWI